MTARAPSGRWIDVKGAAAALGSGALVVRVRLLDGRVMVGTSRPLDPKVTTFAFKPFRVDRAIRLHLDNVRSADVVSFARHADWVATSRAQRLGDFSGRAVRLRAHNAGGTP